MPPQQHPKAVSSAPGPGRLRHPRRGQSPSVVGPPVLRFDRASFSTHGLEDRFELQRVHNPPVHVPVDDEGRCARQPGIIRSGLVSGDGRNRSFPVEALVESIEASNPYVAGQLCEAPVSIAVLPRTSRIEGIVELPENTLLPRAFCGSRSGVRTRMLREGQVSVDKPDVRWILPANGVEMRYGFLAERALVVSELNDRYRGVARPGMVPSVCEHLPVVNCRDARIATTRLRGRPQLTSHHDARYDHGATPYQERRQVHGPLKDSLHQEPRALFVPPPARGSIRLARPRGASRRVLTPDAVASSANVAGLAATHDSAVALVVAERRNVVAAKRGCRGVAGPQRKDRGGQCGAREHQSRNSLSDDFPLSEVNSSLLIFSL